MKLIIVLLAWLSVPAGAASARTGAPSMDSLRAVLRQVREAGPGRWPGVRRRILDGYGEYLRRGSYDPAIVRMRSAELARVLDEARASRDGGPEKRLFELYFDPFRVIETACQTPSDEWPAVKRGILSSLAGAMRDPDAGDVALARVEEIFEAARSGRMAGRAYAAGFEQSELSRRLAEAVAEGTGVRAPARGGVPGWAWPAATLLALPVLALLAVRRRGAAATVFYGLGLAVFFESAARLIVAGIPSASPLFERAWAGDEASNRIKFIKRRARASPSEACYIAHHPVRGWAVKPGADCVGAWGRKVVTSDSRGVRGGVGQARGKVRILVLGDSYTFGDEASDHETYPYHLQELLPGAEVVNMGVSGYGHDQMLLYFKEAGPGYHPDIVIMGFVAADMWRNGLAFTFAPKPRFELKGGVLELGNVPVPNLEETVRRSRYRSAFADLVSIALHKVSARLGRREVRAEKARALTAAILDELLLAVRDAGAKPVFVYLPRSGERRTEEPFLESYCSSRGVPYLSVIPALKEGLEKGLVRRIQMAPRHWTSEEAGVVASSIRDFLRAKGLFRTART